MRLKRELLLGQKWSGNNDKCRNLGGTKEILALSTIIGKPHESRVAFRDKNGRVTWCTRASFVSWISAFKAYISSYNPPSLPGPNVIIQKVAWDGWEAFVEDRILVRAKGTSVLAVFDSIMRQLNGPLDPVQ
jgi:hypothetical protein